MFPRAHVARGLVVNFEGIQKKAEHTFAPESLSLMLPDVWYGNKVAGIRENSLRYDSMNMRVPVDKISKSLHGPDHCRHAAVPFNLKPEHIADSVVCRPAEFTEKFPVVAKIDPQPFRDGKDPLTVRHIGKHLLVKAMSEHKGAFLVAGGAAGALAA